MLLQSRNNKHVCAGDRASTLSQRTWDMHSAGRPVVQRSMQRSCTHASHSCKCVNACCVMRRGNGSLVHVRHGPTVGVSSQQAPSRNRRRNSSRLLPARQCKAAKSAWRQLAPPDVSSCRHSHLHSFQGRLTPNLQRTATRTVCCCATHMQHLHPCRHAPMTHTQHQRLLLLLLHASSSHKPAAPQLVTPHHQSAKRLSVACASPSSLATFLRR